MKAVKRELINRNGTKCMLCGYDASECIEWHHIVPLSEGGKNNYKNGALLCPNCHTLVHKYNYKTAKYTNLTKEMLKNKR